ACDHPHDPHDPARSPCILCLAQRRTFLRENTVPTLALTINDPLTIVLISVCGIVAIVILWVFLSFFSLWLQAWTSAAPVGYLDLIGMRLRKVDLRTIVISRISAVKAGLPVTTNQ